MNSQIAHINPSNTPLRIIIAGGGTGGHIFPAIAIANALKKQQPDCEILFVGALGKMEMEKVPEAGYSIIGLPIAGFNRASFIKNIKLPWLLLQSFLKVRSIFKSFQTTAAIGVGGYSSFPVLKYAQQIGVATFIHESNSFAGKSNILLGKKATRIFVASDGMEKFFPASKIIISGNPVRTSITQAHQIKREEALAAFQLSPHKKTILIVGGSLGAKSINAAIANQFAKIEANQLQLIWQTGKTTAQQYAPFHQPEKGYWVNAFITNMELAYAAADIVISRSGAMAVAELCIAAKPTVFVPFPFAAEDHQTANANHLVQKQAAWLVKDADAQQHLVAKIIALANDESEQILLKSNIAQLAITNADETVANHILNILSK